MALTPGTRLGPYEILSPLGAGGMGEVYRARDPRLARDVAIKVVGGRTAESDGSRKRFEREAQAVAALSHPNIVAVHDVGITNGRIYTVMELLDGETLRARLAHGPLSWRKAVPVAAAIAEGIGAAHARGIVHRDLKPANVFLTADGRVKVLDFGLAQLRQPLSVDTMDALTPSQTDPSGALGTVGYMSPEQVSGRPTDARSDLFALGCVLYEMISGQRAFARETPVETMAATLNEDPPEIVDGVPLELRRLIAHCLEKDPDARFHSARDLAFHLRALLEPSHIDASSGRPPGRYRLVRLAAGAAVLMAFATVYLWLQQPRLPAGAVQSYLMPPDGTTLAARPPNSVTPDGFALSPDGQYVVFVASEPAGKRRLWVQRLDSLAARMLEGTEDAEGPFWSTDSRSIGFNATGQLKTVDVSGGPPQVRCVTNAPRFAFPGGAWGSAGDILFGEYARPLLRVPPSGGPGVPATEMNRARGDTRHCCPAFLPDGRHFLFFVRSSENTGVYLGSLETTLTKFLVRSTGKAVFASPGHLLFRDRGILMAAPFDQTRLEVTGEPTPLTDRSDAFSVSSTGVLLHAPGSSSTGLVWVDRTGREIEEIPISGVFRHQRLSHDGRRLAAAEPDPHTGSMDIWIYDLLRHIPSQLTFDAADELSPVWSANDERLVFTSNRKGRFDIYARAADGTGPEELVYQSGASKGVGSWSPDGGHLLFNTDGEVDGELWSLALPERKPTRLFHGKFLIWDPQISPDGRWIAYMSGESGGRHEVYVQPFPSGARVRVSTSGGRWPRWGPDGKELFFIEDGGRLMAVERKTAGFKDARPRALFPVGTSYAHEAWYNTHDGRRFLFAKIGNDDKAKSLTLVQNWPALLRH